MKLQKKCCFILPLHGNILFSSFDSSQLNGYLDNSDIVIDMSASVAVSRKLSNTPNVNRGISCFLNPIGHDLVVMGEDQNRNLKLTQLEMEYYWAVAFEQKLDKHLNVTKNLVHRYGASCRNTTSSIPQDYVAIHSGIAARSIRSIIDSDSHVLCVFRLNSSSFEVERVDIEIAEPKLFTIGSYTISISRRVFERLTQEREDHLDNETGGLLLGAVDFESQTVYIVGATGAPRYSEQMPSGFIRAANGFDKNDESLEDWFLKIYEKTLGNLTYLGEWHSHPRGAKSNLSDDDKTLFNHIQQGTVTDGRPAVMIIACDEGKFRIIIGETKHQKEITWSND